MTSIIMIILASAAFGAGGLVLGQQWADMAESIRIGTQHLSNRGFRLPIKKHPSGAFLFAMTLFLSIAVPRCWGKRNALISG